MTVVAVQDLSKCFAPGDRPAVDGVSFSVERGEILALVGPSGCGKSTTLRLIGGFERPSAGEVRLSGAVVVDERTLVPPERRRVGMVFQDFALFPHLTVRENVAFGLRRRSAIDVERLRWALALCSLGDVEARYPHELSGGQQQRVALARALAPGFPLVLLDEPLSNLDAVLRRAIRAELRRMLEAASVAAILVTHDREEALELADRVAVMRDGRIEQIGTPLEVYDRPATPFVATFVCEAMPLPGRVAGERIETELGTCANSPQLPDGAAVDVMVKASEVAFEPAREGTAEILSSTYRGDHAVSVVSLPSGATVRARRLPGEMPSPGTRGHARLLSAAPAAFLGVRS